MRLKLILLVLNAEKNIEIQRNEIKKNGSILYMKWKKEKVNSGVNKKASLDTRWLINTELFPLKLYQII